MSSPATFQLFPSLRTINHKIKIVSIQLGK
jgi:hypothetical protein